MTPTDPPGTDERPTEELLDARYRLGELVGTGGSATVYRAEDTLLGRTVAIKVLGGDGDAVTPERARSETAVLASLNHPHLVTLFDAHLIPGRTQYLVMEFVDGPTLRSRLDSGPLTSAEAGTLAHDLAEALRMVHASGVIHRDVKPSNVLLGPPTRRDAEWTAKLADFGIAHALDDPRVTTPGLVIGTAAYMAPEQISQGFLGPAVDIYSLGLVLLEALTGRPVYPGTRGVESALARLSAPPAIPASLGRGWTDLLHRMTNSDPARRPTAHQIADAASALVGTGATPPVAAASPLEDDGDATAAIEVAGEDATAVLAGTRAEIAPTGPTRVMPAAASAATTAAPGEALRRRRTLIGTASAAAVLAVAAIAGGVWAAASADGDAPRAATRIGAHSVFAPDQATTETPGDDAGTTPASDDSSNSNGKDDKSNNGKGDENKNDNGKSNGNGKKK